MTFDMRGYLDLIAKKGELAVVKKKVSTKFEIAAVTAKMDGSKALLFENVKDSKFRVVSNLVGTRKRFAYAVGASEGKIHEKVISAIKHASKPKTTTKAKFLENQSRDLFTLTKNQAHSLHPQSYIRKIRRWVRKTHHLTGC